MLAKNKPGRSKRYLEYIRSEPCCACQATPAEPHHTAKAGVGMKSSDFSTIPLCRKHHSELHNNGIVRFENDNHIILSLVVATYTVAFLDIHFSDGR